MGFGVSVNVAEGVIGVGVNVNVGDGVEVSLGFGVMEGIDTSVLAPVAGAQAYRRRITINGTKFFIVRLVELAASFRPLTAAC